MKKVVIITGAGGDLGKVTVRVFLQNGYHVIATVRKEGDIPQLGKNDNLDVLIVDLLDEKAVKDFVRQVINKHKQIDAALMLAGGFAMASLASTDQAALREMYTMNFETAYNLANPVFQQMISQKEGGRLIFIGSKPALDSKAAKGKLAYTLSKSLLVKLAECLNEEGASKEVHSYLLAPNTLDTPSNRKAMPEADFTKWVSAEDFSKMMLFLCSEPGNKLREGVFKMYGD